MSISSELLTLNNTKTAIRTAINQKGGSVGASDTFASYATAIDNLPSGGGNPILKSIDVSDFTGTTFNKATTYITDITIPSGVTTLVDNAFNGLSITSISIPNTVTSIGNSAFSDCVNLTSVTLPNAITSLSNSLFNGCQRLASITIPNTVTSIGSNTFTGCSSLTTVTIPSGVTSIGRGAFANCTSLTSVICLATTPPTMEAIVFNGTNSCPIYVPAESVDTYKAASGWSSYADRIQAIPTE